MPGLKPILVTLAGKERFQRLLAGTPATAGMKSGCVSLQPGESVGEHKTESKEEAIIILEGTAAIYCEGAIVFTGKANDLVYMPPETNHDIQNTGQAVLKYVYVVAPVSQGHADSL